MSIQRSDKVTIEMCYHKGDDKDPCINPPMWKLKTVDGSYRFKVCDAHLAWCIRLCGFPALVDTYETSKIKNEEKVDD